MDHNKLRTILKEMGIPDHLTCLLRNLYAGQEATVTPSASQLLAFSPGKEQAAGVWDNFSSKEQVFFNFMAAVTICSDFGAPKNKIGRAHV